MERKKEKGESKEGTVRLPYTGLSNFSWKPKPKKALGLHEWEQQSDLELLYVTRDTLFAKCTSTLCFGCLTDVTRYIVLFGAGKS